MNKQVSFLGYLLLCSFSVFAQQEPNGVSENQERVIDSIFKKFDNDITPGISVGFIQNSQLIYSKGYGMADLEHNIIVDTNSVFSLASVSKQFTVFALLLLEEQGKVSLDDDVKNYLPYFPDYNKKITLRQLAAHTSGVKSHLQLLAQKGFISDNVITKNDALNIIYRQDELNFDPGEEFSYSNSGYVLLAEVVEQVSGKPFPVFLEEQIFQPLGMTHSFVMDDYHKIVKNRANSYEIDNGDYVNAPANYSYYGATGLYSTITDLSKWSLNFYNPKIGSTAIFEKMKTLSELNNGNTFGHALGQFVEDYNGLEYIHHSGGDAGYRTFLGRFPESKSAVLLLSNNNTIDAQSLALEVVNVFLKPYFKAETSQISNTKATIEIVELPKSKLNDYTGSYLNQNSFITRNIFVRNDTLIYSRQEQNGRETPLLPLNEKNTFQLGGYTDLHIIFKQEKNNKKMQVLENEIVVETYDAYSSRNYDIKELEEFIGHYYSQSLDTKYVLKIQNDKLIIKHTKMNEIELSSLKENGFLSSSWQFRFLEFKRDSYNKIIGFSITSDRVRNSRFEKISD